MVEFCPYCDAPSHKVMDIKEYLFYCRVCFRFFSLKQEFLKCPKCDRNQIKHTDFPMPTGEMVFQCLKCRKMFPAKEVFIYNHIIDGKV